MQRSVYILAGRDLIEPILECMVMNRIADWSPETLIEVAFDSSLVPRATIIRMYECNLLRIAKRTLVEAINGLGFELNHIESIQWSNDGIILYVYPFVGIDDTNAYTLPPDVRASYD